MRGLVAAVRARLKREPPPSPEDLRAIVLTLCDLDHPSSDDDESTEARIEVDGLALTDMQAMVMREAVMHFQKALSDATYRACLGAMGEILYKHSSTLRALLVEASNRPDRMSRARWR